MKRMFLIAVLTIVAVCIPISAQTAHTAKLTITASPDSTTGNPGTTAIYRAAGVCPASGLGSLTFAAVTTSGPASGSYTDTLPGPGSYCYYMTATISGVTSIPSSTGGGTAGPFPPTFTVVVQ